MTRPDLEAKAREIAGAAIEAGYRECLDRQFACDINTKRFVGISGHGRETLEKHVAAAFLAALTEADAAATERAAKVATKIGAELREHAIGGAIAAAIRNQESTDA